jgi:outer membrane protein, multidrug efflux system
VYYSSPMGPPKGSIVPRRKSPGEACRLPCDLPHVMRSLLHRRLNPVFALAPLVLAFGVVGRVPPALARAYTLAELLELARKGNPGLAAGAQATARVEAQLLEAERSWMPSGEVLGLLAPAPEIRCVASLPNPGGIDDKTWRERNCSETRPTEASINLRGVFTRTELRLVQPLFTFGKIAAGRLAATEGVAASRNREAGLAADLDFNVKRAYWGFKLARSVIDTLVEGRGYLDDAEKRVDEQLKEGTGTATQTDRLRLRTVRAEVDVRMLEAERMADLARSGLRALIGSAAPADMDVDPEPLEPLEIPTRPLGHYEEQARLSRPEVRALDHFVASKRALADLERRKQYPDLVLLGTATYGYASSIDNPRNAFANDPFNIASAGLAAALRVPLDLGVRNARAAGLQAEAEEAALRRREALGGIAFEVQRAFGELTEAQKRLGAVSRGERAAKAWINAVAQNFATGLAEVKDFADALLAFFQFRVRALQASHDLNLAAAALSRATGAEVAR